MLPTIPGFWPDYYLCRDTNILETLNRMLTEHSPDFPNTACGGFEILKFGDYYKIIPIVLRKKKGTICLVN